MYDSSKLRGRIIEVYGSYERFCRELKISRPTLNKRLAYGDWNQSEIFKVMDMLHILPREVHIYFFTEDVGKK